MGMIKFNIFKKNKDGAEKNDHETNGKAAAEESNETASESGAAQNASEQTGSEQTNAVKTENVQQKNNIVKAAAARIKAKRKKLSAGKLRLIIIITVIAILAIVFIFIKVRNAGKKAAANTVDSKNISTVMRGTVVNELTSSGSLSPKDTYNITSLVSGEIIKADFEEGDQVEAGQVLYVLDSTDVTADIETAKKTLSTSERDLEDAKDDYEKALAKLNNGTYVSKSAGYIKNLTLKAGTSLNNNAQIATLYNNTSMKLRLPFLYNEADMLGVGQDMIVVFSDTGETLPGRIIEKSSLKETLSGGAIVKYVTIVVSNPGGISTTDRGTAYVGSIYSAGDALFEAYTEENLTVDIPASVKVDKVLVSEGQYVGEGTALFTITEDSYNDAVKTFEKAVTNAENTLENAKTKLNNLNDQLEEYTITAPISGQVISKSGKVGDKVSSNGNSTTTLAIIYDLSELTFEMSIDELDISNVEVGQDVVVTADAFDGVNFSGHVTNVSLNGSYSSGVTSYPVVVTLDDSGNLLPSMNVNGVIILERSDNTLYIPASALQRGNVVYVKESSLTEAATAAETESASKADAKAKSDSKSAEESSAETAAEASAAGKKSGNGESGENTEGSAESGEAANAEHSHQKGERPGSDGSGERPSMPEGSERPDFSGSGERPSMPEGSERSDSDGSSERPSFTENGERPDFSTIEGGHSHGEDSQDSGSESKETASADSTTHEKASGGNTAGNASGSGASGAASTATAASMTSAASSEDLSKYGTVVENSNAPTGFKAVRVKTGIVSDDYVEILYGLSEGQEIYVSHSTPTTSSWNMMGGGPGGMGDMGGMGGMGMSGGGSGGSGRGGSGGSGGGPGR